MKPERQSDWRRVRDLAFGLGLPGIEETTSLKQQTLKTHGKLWVWWSPYEDALVFKVPVEERAILIEAEPDTFFVTPHYQEHPMVLVRPDRLDLVHALARVDYPRKLPHVLPIDDVARLIEAAPGPGLQYKAALSIAYGAGLRSEEVVMLRVANIDSKRMLIRVEQGAARQSRCDALSPRLSRYRRSCLA